jgi:SIR2-like domain
MRPVTGIPDVVLSGAGISFDKPSQLASPWDLMMAVWDAIRATEPGLLSDEDSAEVIRRLGEKGYAVRMEQFLNALSGREGIPAITLAEVYRLVASDAVNDNHLRLASMPGEQFTVNMDTLLESAGTERVRHLHGTWDRPKSIKTTVDHYAHGLPSSTRRRFGHAIRGRHLLIIGYSGQDIDVMPVIEQYPPRHITWVAPDAEDLGLEANALKEAREQRHLGFEPRAETAAQYLTPLVPHVRAGKRSTLTPSLDLAKILKERTSHEQRLLGVAEMLITLGMSEVALGLLGRDSFKRHAEKRRVKLTARALARLGRPKEALAALRATGGRWANASEIASVARRAGDLRAERTAKLLLATRFWLPGARRQRWLGRVVRGKRLAVYGDLKRAVRLMDSVTRERSTSRVVGPANLVDALTWHADALKDRGDFRAAHRIARRAEQLAPFGDESQRAFALWKGIEIDVLSGLGGEASGAVGARVRDRFESALHFARRSGSPDTLWWIQGTFIEYLARYDVDAAMAQIVEEDAAGATSPGRPGHGAPYFALQCAIALAAMGRLSEADERAREAISRSADYKVPTLALQAEHFRLYLRWLTGERAALRPTLRRIANEAQRRDLRLVAARAWAAANSVVDEPPSKSLVRRAEKLGWDLDDLRRMSTRDTVSSFFILV